MNNFKSLLKELDKICKLPVTAKVLSRENYSSHLDYFHYNNPGKKASKQNAIDGNGYFFSFKISEGECVIYQTENMYCETEWIEKKAKSTEVAVRRAAKEFYKRYNR